MSPDQLSLLAPRSRRSDPPTSIAAAQSITPGRLEALICSAFHANRIWIEARGGLTDDELTEVLLLEHAPSVKTARSRLSRAGVLVDSGCTRPSNRGRPMIVWILASATRQ